MGKKGGFVFILTVLACIIAFPASGLSETYKYVNEDGTIVLTSDKDSIPENCRDSVEELQEEQHTDGYKPSIISSALSTTKLGAGKAVGYLSSHASFIAKLPGFFFTHPKDVFAGILKMGVPFFILLGVIIISFVAIPQKLFSKRGEVLGIITLILCCTVISYFLLRVGLSAHLEALASVENLDTSQRTIYCLIENISK